MCLEYYNQMALRKINHMLWCDTCKSTNLHRRNVLWQKLKFTQNKFKSGAIDGIEIVTWKHIHACFWVLVLQLIQNPNIIKIDPVFSRRSFPLSLILCIWILNTETPALKNDEIGKPKLSDQFSPKWAQFWLSRWNSQMKNLKKLKFNCIRSLWRKIALCLEVSSSEQLGSHIRSKKLFRMCLLEFFRVKWGHELEKGDFDQMKQLKLTAIFLYKCAQFYKSLI